MNQLTKILEQYEKKNPGKKARKSGKWAFTLDFTIWQANEIEKLSSRTTCGEEQRKFLDEIEKTYKFKDMGMGVLIKKKNWRHDVTEIMQKDFAADLSKVIKGE